MRLLPCWIRLGNPGTRLAQPKAQLPEQALTLPHSQVNLVSLRNPSRQSLAVPQISAQSQIAGHTAKGAIDLSELLLVQAPGPARSLPLLQSGQALGLKTPDPILDRSWSIPQQPRHFRTSHALGHQKHSMKPMVISRFFRATNLILQSENHRRRVSNGERTHASMRTRLAIMRNYL